MKVNLSLLETLAAIVEEQTFEAAADKLCLTQSAVSQRLRQLESTLGQTLLVRSTPLALTDAGHSALRYFQQAKLLQNEFLDSINQTTTEYTQLHLGVNADSLATWLFDALETLLAKEKVLLHIKVDDQDKTRELMTTGEVIGCISSDEVPIKGCNCFYLGTMKYRCLVSPGFKKLNFSKTPTREELQNTPAIQFNHKDDLQKHYMERYFSTSDIGIKHRIPSTESYLDLIKRGYGWGMAPDIQSQPLLNEGSVEELIPNQTLEIPLYWHIWNLKTQLNQQLTDHIRNYASKVLDA
ncbi:LysR family transcriptional regulator ArgP [Litoribrevibacter albus]|uniref:Transcriptional regulator ArgP n=1 Tax=Litoribrevibacter albus TaxID=1473156 RepID=A0AA37W469_9GAMM|nr:LysR family transcriptional regulator ArgP [Litoribrevibacter albus]GLQ29847.1 transcriptional regulator ArgP [Litoribrevibacter albus]